MKLGVKAKRNIGLVVVTIAVVVAIILIVYFVQKSDEDKKLKYGHIGQVVSTSQADICVKDWTVVADADGYTVGEGKCIYLLKVEIKANKNIRVSSSKFEVKDGKNLTAEGIQREEYFKGGRSETFEILYEVESNRIESYYLEAFGVKIDLGGTVQPHIAARLSS